MYVADARTASESSGPGPHPGRTLGPLPAADTRAVARPAARTVLRAVPHTVLVLGTVSLITDVSSEMVTAVLPLYLVAELGLSPLGFGLLDGVYNGVSALVRLVGGHLADRGRRHKTTAALGYGLSALCKPALLAVHSVPLIGAVLAVDRMGKGLRTAPRDAMISLAAPPEAQGRSFGVHRAMDTTGALLGPLTAFFVLRTAAGGFDAVFVVSFCIATMGVLVLLLFAPGRVPAPAPPSGAAVTPAPATGRPAAAAATVSVRAALALLGRPHLRRLTGCAFVLGLATVSDSFVYLLLQRRLDLSERWFPLLPLGTAGAFLLLAVPLGHAADRFGRWRVFLAGHLGLLVAYGLLLAPTHATGEPVGPVTVAGLVVAGLPVAVLVLHGAFYAATDGVLMAAAAGSVPAELRASGLALVQTGQAGARFGCSLSFGAVWTAWGSHTALIVATVTLATCVAASAFIRPIAVPIAAPNAAGETI
ncbi:MFS transporter [Frankia sp. Cas4]|uniref:MFS transporter n=1 Tax=Frankia sp. Cas4 TaxID=3073927 RepID=UPI002AD49782|nr:MFS transporter [Frankia sp. Cas4]